MKRKPVSRKKSKKIFTKNALKVHPRNVNTSPMRGGIRL